LLIDVTRAQRRVFGRRRMLDVPVHADRAAMNDAPHARTLCGLNDETDRGRVHGPVVAGRETCGAVKRRDVEHDIDALDGASDPRRPPGVAAAAPPSPPTEIARSRATATERPPLNAGSGKPSRQPAACEAGCAGHEHLHRSATIVTGEPKSRRNPRAAMPRSIASVRFSEPVIL